MLTIVNVIILWLDSYVCFLCFSKFSHWQESFFKNAVAHKQSITLKVHLHIEEPM